MQARSWDLPILRASLSAANGHTFAAIVADAEVVLTSPEHAWREKVVAAPALLGHLSPSRGSFAKRPTSQNAVRDSVQFTADGRDASLMTLEY